MEIQRKLIEEIFINITKEYLSQGATLESLRAATTSRYKKKKLFHGIKWKIILICVIISIIIATIIRDDIFGKFVYETRCYIPNNYLIWEFSRPNSNCDFCKDVNEALILKNITRDEFNKYAYSSRPIIVKGAAKQWKASNIFNLNYFRKVYDSIDGAYESIEEECQFLHFKSNFTNLKQVFHMSDERAMNIDGQEPWYVGWKNCHPGVLEEINKYYNVPHFLPEDAEIPQTNYIFMGYEQGASMHLDYIPRLMWQGQILGRKTWAVAPTPECEKVCKHFNFQVDTGDVILLDTRLWYHGTFVRDKEFSLTVTSEYG